MRDDFSGLKELLSVADKRSFTAAAAQLRVTPSAVSQSITALERRVGVRLLNRNTRSVGLSEAGARFIGRLRPALEGVHAAFESLDEIRDRPVGTLRLNVPGLASSMVIEPLLASFLAAHPDLRVDITVDDGFTSIVDGNYDAGIRLGEMLEKDMIAQRVTADMRTAIVAAPSYFAKRAKPRVPKDLMQHDCINYRQIASGSIYRWEFTVKGRDVAILVDGRVVTNGADLMLRAALDGLGIAYLLESVAAPYLADNRLVRVLTAYSPRFPGLYLYYPSRANMAPKLRALVDFFRSRRG